MKERFIDFFTDFGFKKLFGVELNKDLLIDFLNTLLRGKRHIKDLSYVNNELLGKTADNRNAVLDLHCIDLEGNIFIIELQKAKQIYFKDRSIYYSACILTEQAPKGEWDYELKEVYSIGIMDFIFDDRHPGQFLHDVKLVETTCHDVFYDKLTYIFLEMPKFTKKETELETHFDKWLFLLGNLSQLQEIPKAFQERIFKKVFQEAEILNLNEQDMKAYDESLKNKRDWKNAIDTAVQESREKGREEREVEIAREMKKKNISIEIISEITGLSISEIEKL